VSIKRIPAKKVRIIDILKGRFFYGSKEEMKPSYLITPLGQKFSRVSLIGTVVDKFVSDNYSSITLDDGTGVVRVKTFRESTSLLESIEPGDLVITIGKVKEYNGERYVNGEVVRKVNDPNYETLTKLEILSEIIQKKEIATRIVELASEMSKEELENYVKENYGMDAETLNVILESKEAIDYKPKILKLIENLDEGNGAEIGKIFELSKLPENVIENTLDELMNKGYIYEPVAGHLKIVKT